MPKPTARAVSLAFRDISDEPASMKVGLKLAATDPQITALKDAIIAMTALRLRSYTTEVANFVSGDAGTGQREMRLLVRYHDGTTGDKFSLSIPGFNTAIALLPQSDFLDPDDTEYIAFKAAFEACAVSAYTDNTVVLDSIEQTRGQK